MFGLDAATWNTVWPSLIGVAGITAAMVWASVVAYSKVKNAA